MIYLNILDLDFIKVAPKRLDPGNILQLFSLSHQYVFKLSLFLFMKKAEGTMFISIGTDTLRWHLEKEDL
jgi:hypothetical protein